MDLDEIYTQIGEFGPQQKLYFFSLAIFNIYAPFNMIQVVFTGQAPSFTCTTSDKVEFINQCPNNSVTNCESVKFNTLPDTFSREWGLICDQSYKTNLIQSILMAGVMTGALAFGPIADLYGRKVTLFATTIGVILTGASSSMMPAFSYYAIARFFTGFFTAGNMISSFVLASELVGPSKRGICGNIIQTFFAIGIISYSALGYWVRSWRYLSLISSSLGGIFLFTFLWIPESPRWLLTHKKVDEVTRILTMIATNNNKVLPMGAVASIRGHIAEAEEVGLCHIFKNLQISTITLIQLFSWFVNSVVYYGLTLGAGELGSNIYTSEALSGAVEIPAYVAATVLIEWSGRRKTLAGFMIMGGVSCLIVKWNSNILFPLLGKLAIAASFSIIYIQSAELFPTVLRNSGLGLCSCFARIGGILSPLTSFANDFTHAGQFLILGVLGVSSGLLNLWLPETLHKPMPDTIQDLETLLSGYSELRFDPIESEED